PPQPTSLRAAGRVNVHRPTPGPVQKRLPPGCIRTGQVGAPFWCRTACTWRLLHCQSSGYADYGCLSLPRSWLWAHNRDPLPSAAVARRLPVPVPAQTPLDRTVWRAPLLESRGTAARREVSTIGSWVVPLSWPAPVSSEDPM